ncbi:lipid-binding protein [Paramarasmius palmivorus]|uniref:Lipid-binding protein n=1 Tax=Paramarasmius palmivorus TaxID=297713 RepID=A0AAW0E6M1_9AGAR
MPVPGFLSSFADKAQTALQSSPLGQHIPGHRPTSPDASTQPSANESAQGWGGQHKSHAFEAIQYQIRSLGQQYGSTTPVQKIITTEKGVAIDFDSVARDAKAQSKELYMWGQNEQDDLKDVTDRLAYLNFVQGSLASSLAAKLDAARAPLKTLRDAETALQPRRNIRSGLRTQIARIEHDQQKGYEKKLAELRDQLRKAELDDASAEAEIELLKRQGVKASESLKFEAFREFGEKLVLVSQAAASLVDVLPTVPPSQSSPYTGAQRTGSIRASLQRALDNYKTGHINLPTQSNASDLSRSDTVSFGESHASELSSISSSIPTTVEPGIPLTPPAGAKSQSPPLPITTDTAPVIDNRASPPTKTQSPPINPSDLNLSPAPIPHISSTTSASISGGALSTTSPAPVAPDPLKPASVLPAITPTVAETGVPVSAGAGGPGPSSGSLRDLKSDSANPGGPQSPPKWESAEEEKKRLASLYSQAYGSTAPTAAPPQHESAEDEKKRLEREERERALQGGPNDPTRDSTKKDKDEDLPPYQDL